MAKNATSFKPGNAGRPKGAKNVTTRTLETLMAGEAEAITRKAVEMAKAGDTVAMRLCLERLLPVRKGRPVEFDLPKVESLDDIPIAGTAIIRAVADGKLSPEEASSVMAVISGFRQALETSELVERLRKLEELAVEK